MTGKDMRNRFARLAVVACALFAGAAGCSSSGLPIASNGPNSQGFSTNNTLVRFVNGSPDLGPVDVYLDGRLALPAVPFGAVAPVSPLTMAASYASVPAGGVLVVLYAAGTKTLVAPPFSFNTKPGDRWSVVAAGHVVGPSTFAMLPFNDGHFNTPPNTFAFSFHNASPNQGSASVTFSCSDCAGSPATFPVALGAIVPPQLDASNDNLNVSSAGAASNSPFSASLTRPAILPQNFFFTYVDLSLYEIDADAAGSTTFVFGIDLNG